MCISSGRYPKKIKKIQMHRQHPNCQLDHEQATASITGSISSHWSHHTSNLSGQASLPPQLWWQANETDTEDIEDMWDMWPFLSAFLCFQGFQVHLRTCITWHFVHCGPRPGPLRSTCTGFQVKTSTQLFSSPAHNFKAFVNWLPQFPIFLVLKNGPAWVLWRLGKSSCPTWKWFSNSSCAINWTCLEPLNFNGQQKFGAITF